MQWLFFVLTMFLGRLGQMFLLYFAKVPNGEDYAKELGYTFSKEMLLAFCYIAFFGAVLFAVSKISKKAGQAAKILGLLFGALYLILSAGNDELLRWMSQHLTLSFLFTYFYAVSDWNLVSMIFEDGLWHFASLIAVTFFSIALLAFVSYFRKLNFAINKKIEVVVFSVFASLGIAAMLFGSELSKNQKDFERIAPVAYHLANDAVKLVVREGRPLDYEKGIAFLGGDPGKKYPFYHKAENEKESLENFLNKPLEEKPDIVLLTIESFRGWTGDVTNEEMCNAMPNYCALAKAGIYYRHAYSVGFPSVEGFLGVQAGLWSHPDKSLLSNYYGSRFRALPEILGRAGYYREVLSISNPRFDRMQAWVMKWYDRSGYRKGIDHDMNLAKIFVEMYRERPKDKPLFINWMSHSMHAPYRVPLKKGEEPKKRSPMERYDRALSFTDHAIGVIVNEIKKGERANNTLFIIVGDHSFHTGLQQQRISNEAHAGFVWVPIVISGPGIPQDSVVNAAVSQANIAPTILQYLGLDVSHNFPAKSLFEPEGRAMAIVHDDAALFTDSLAYYSEAKGADFTVESNVKLDGIESGPFSQRFIAGFKEEGDFSEMKENMLAAVKAWRWVLDNDLLMPEEK